MAVGCHDGPVKRPDLGVVSRLLQVALKLGPPLTRDLAVSRDLRVPMADGVELLADRWAPREGGDGLPVALLRSPYGRRGVQGTTMALPLAERGFQVVLQSVRGTFGSGGTFDPLRHERDDGLETVKWLRAQPWYGGSIVLTGPSYLGYVQWAIADDAPDVVAMVPQVTDTAITMGFLRPDAFSLEAPFNWGVMIQGQERTAAIVRNLVSGRRVRHALRSTPLGQADRVALGRRDDYLQDILAHDNTSPRWEGVDQSARLEDVHVPISSIGGWFDIFLPGQLRDFETLQARGREVHLTVGPWTHTAPALFAESQRETLAFGLAHARGEQPPAREPVRLWVAGADAWREFPSWPPPGVVPTSYRLGPARSLYTHESAGAGCDRFRYDPTDPTPAVGGVRMSLSGIDRPGFAGAVDNRALEARPDVLVYSTDPLLDDVDVIGHVGALVWFRSSLPSADVFVRLCDVDGRGRSTNVCDGLVRVEGADELAAVAVDLWPTAHRFRRGHRIRVQVSSGAFPRFARNPGTGEPHATVRRFAPADQEVWFGGDHPSLITLPILP
jgi:putative CocE/NonD family hydrolase